MKDVHELLEAELNFAGWFASAYRPTADVVLLVGSRASWNGSSEL